MFYFHIIRLKYRVDKKDKHLFFTKFPLIILARRTLRISQ